MNLYKLLTSALTSLKVIYETSIKYKCKLPLKSKERKKIVVNFFQVLLKEKRK